MGDDTDGWGIIQFRIIILRYSTLHIFTIAPPFGAADTPLALPFSAVNTLLKHSTALLEGVHLLLERGNGALEVLSHVGRQGSPHETRVVFFSIPHRMLCEVDGVISKGKCV